MSERLLGNFIDGAWRASRADESLEVTNPATGAALARVPMSPAAEVDEAVAIAADAFQQRRRTPPNERVQ